MEPREDSDNQSIAIAKEVFGVTDNRKVLLDVSTPLMWEFVRKNGEIGSQVLMERAPRIPSDTYDRSYINAGTPSGSKFLKFLGKIIVPIRCIARAESC